MKKFRHATKEIKNKAIKLYLEGKSLQAVADIFGYDLTAVVYWLKAKGIQRRSLSESHKGQHSSPATEFKKGFIPWNREKEILSMRGEKNPAWKGGTGNPNSGIRSSYKYQAWRRDVLVRDQFTCQRCGHKLTQIVVHHIKEFDDYPELRFDFDNGKTLCRACHCKIHNPAKKGMAKANKNI